MLYANCFMPIEGTTITAQGYVQNDTEINMSSIYTKLIQEAGRLCDNYASDLIYYIQDFDKKLASQSSETRLLGFRESGVDIDIWIMHKTPEELCAEYRAIWRLTSTFTDDNRVEVVLQRVRYNTTRHYTERGNENA